MNGRAELKLARSSLRLSIAMLTSVILESDHGKTISLGLSSEEATWPSKESGRDTTTSSPRGNSQRYGVFNQPCQEKFYFFASEYIVEDLHGCYAPPKLDPEHEERLKILSILVVSTTGSGTQSI
ncbi:hypothetical protein TEA_016578 [Camellia sinensis var. sinensis]|uniref:Uncharacterized protein n=1 Tax=Camellia sinensis var. sinensis TaxID=542762 RepID=A0A4S4D9Q4_CAMSN|nr:hypothetical protein TEA_016578 [Camellia sinensis var. sinensis]